MHITYVMPDKTGASFWDVFDAEALALFETDTDLQNHINGRAGTETDRLRISRAALEIVCWGLAVDANVRPISVQPHGLRVAGTFDLSGVQTTTAPQSAVETGGGTSWIGYRPRTGVPSAAVGKRSRARWPVCRPAGSADGWCGWRRRRRIRSLARATEPPAALRRLKGLKLPDSERRPGLPFSSRLSGATAMPQPRTVEFDPARQPVPAFRPPVGLRTGQGPLGIALESATEPLGTPSGACAAGDVRERQASLPEPVPTTGYRTPWNAFVRWCGEHNAQHWPASPETVADYLRHRAEHCGIEVVYSARNAIAATHRRAGWGELFAGGVVAATLAELSSIKGKGRSRCRSVSGSSLRVAEMDKIRRTALEPRRRGGGFESHECAMRRGRVDLALCSLVLEAGLRPEQAAALEWRDLAVDANERPTVTIRRGSPGAGTVVEISKRAHDDLRTIAPKSAKAGQWIFGLNALQIIARIRSDGTSRGTGTPN